MKKFLIKTAWFVVPVALMVAYTQLFYHTNGGDLVRMGFLSKAYDYPKDSLFGADFARPEQFKKVSQLDLNKKHKCKVVVIGDSFSDLSGVSYYNYMATANEVLAVDRYINDNPLETLQGLLNGGFFDNVETQYVLLQSVERDVPMRRDFDEKKLITTDTIRERIKENAKLLSQKTDEDAGKDLLFSNKNLKFTRNNLLYYIDDNAFYTDSYKVGMTKSIFTSDKKELLFFKDDLKRFDENSNPENINKLNARINKFAASLAKKGITLIFMPAPDKLGMYHDYLEKKDKYKYSGFLKKFALLKKNYLYVDTQKLLGTMITKGEKDVYYFDDTHWSPKAAKVVGQSVDSLIAGYER